MVAVAKREGTGLWSRCLSEKVVTMSAFAFVFVLGIFLALVILCAKG
jgi:hypothetical protein